MVESMEVVAVEDMEEVTAEAEVMERPKGQHTLLVLDRAWL